MSEQSQDAAAEQAEEAQQEAADQADQPAPEDSHETPDTDWKAEARKWEDRSKSNHKDLADTKAKLDAVLTALGLGDNTPDDPAKAAEQYKTQAQTAEQKLAVFTATPAGVDAHALLDSQAFLGSLADVPADKLADHITAYAEANPRFKLAPANAGARDAAQRGSTPAAQKSMDDWLRGK